MLYIQALKEMRDGKPYYTSGRINTQSKHTFQYGRFEVRAKVPSGKGFLPAFWMMPENESYYGQWPKCGEIDIMEVHGSALDTSYSTLHFGEPHRQLYIARRSGKFRGRVPCVCLRVGSGRVPLLCG